MVCPAMPANGRFRPTVAEFGAAQLAASGAPWSLRKRARDEHVDLRHRVGAESRCSA